MTTHKMNKNQEKLFWELGLKNGFKVVRRSAGIDYDAAREISNSRFNQKPAAIAFPKTAKQVGVCLKFCKDHKIAFRIRSGGHQHEGMSSLDDGIIIRLSEMNQIEYEGEDKAWIPTGKALKEVYDELELREKTIPGGGCWSVNVGGLALGGGWGTSARKMGLTCDNFEKVEIVLANGDVVMASGDKDDKYKDLFWALRGGGGGNFGIVTKFLFKLHSIGDYISTVNLQWKNLGEKETEMVEWYLDNQKDFPKDLTSVLSLRVQHKDMLSYDKEGNLNSTYSPLALIGKFYGRKVDLEDIFNKNKFLENFKPDNHKDSWFKENPVSEKAKKEQEALAISDFNAQTDRILLSDIINDFVDGYTGVSEMNEFLTDIGLDFDEVEGGETEKAYKKLPPPSITCLTPHPHKISSGYPVKGKHADLARKLVKKVKEANELKIEGVRLYIVLHGMPGESAGIKSDESAFYYRDKDLLLQFQSWWENPNFAGSLAGVKKPDYNSVKFEKEWRAYEEDEKFYVDWISNVRESLSDELEGAFINFVDKKIDLEEYYGENFTELKRIKSIYDAGNVFDFPMSIPLAK